MRMRPALCRIAAVAFAFRPSMVTATHSGALLVQALMVGLALIVGPIAAPLSAMAFAADVPSSPTASQPKPKPEGSRAIAPSAKPATTPTISRPRWVDLTPAQQQALQPLAAEWDRIDAPRKKKWLEIGDKFAMLKPEQQARLQERMREWAKLTPEQRRVARESYSRANKLDPREKSAEWQHYQQLPEEQKKKLAEEAAKKKRVANLPPASQQKPKVNPPPKSVLKADLQKRQVPGPKAEPRAASPGQSTHAAAPSVNVPAGSVPPATATMQGGKEVSSSAVQPTGPSRVLVAPISPGQSSATAAGQQQPVK